jgi:hypothetical protein
MCRALLSVILATFVAACASAPPNDDAATTAPASGGKNVAGGALGKGGAPGPGGESGNATTANGGVTSSGGSSATGGGGASGSAGTAGASSPPTVACTDTSSMAAIVNDQYGTQPIVVDNSSKTYMFQANWWGTPYDQQSESISGLGFTVTNSGATTSNPSDPLGFPSIYIGSYQGKGTTGSNLPKLVSSLTSVPTIFSVNATSDTSSLNATYDVWFSQSSSGVSGSNPGSGGAYLMVWLFKPSSKQPRGNTVIQGYSVGTVPGSWSVWYDPTNNGSTQPCVSYVSSTPLSELEFDLNDFIKDAISHNWGVTSSQYLSIVFAGTEIWSGGNGFQVKQFCANVE